MPVIYPHLLDPTAYPDYTRRPVRVPTWDTFGGVTQFMTLRSLSHANWRENLDRYQAYEQGIIIWPNNSFLDAPHVTEAVEELHRRGLFLFDLWGYVPGSPTNGMWANKTSPPGMIAFFQQTLGDHFLGMDNGEQDGRYVGSYASQQCPSFHDHRAQYFNFQRHFERLGDDLEHHLSALVSLCFGHYFLKEGDHVLLGAETAQALPNSQVYYLFIRGAGKQYGVPWFGNASCFNRWGFKQYAPPGSDIDGDFENAYGPELGTSLSLLKRLMYTHYLYNCVGVGFELGYLTEHREYAIDGEEEKQAYLSPIGAIQRGAARFVTEHGMPGVMHAPVGLLLDFFAGWTMPRHLYTTNIYQTWGALPYETSDYLTHGILSLLYPGYDDASYFRDERGFLTATPFGDMADGLLSDASLPVLRQYGLLIAAGALTPGEELRDKLHAFMAGGGELVLTAENARHLLTGIEIATEPERIAPGTPVHWTDDDYIVEEHAFDLYHAALPPEAQVLARCGGKPAVARVPVGEGSCLLLLAPYGLNAEPLVQGPLVNVEEASLVCPYRLLAHARCVIGEALARQQLFSVGDGLGYVTCRKGPGEYTLGIYNNDLTAKPFAITSHCGRIRAMTELTLDQSEKGCPGYWPTGYADHDGGSNDMAMIAGGEFRLFALSVAEQQVTVLPPVDYPVRPRGHILTLHGNDSVQEQVEARPTFFEHFDGVKVDWTYLFSRGESFIARRRGWVARQQLRLVVDFSHRMNFYPDLCLLDTYLPQYEASTAAIDDVLAKMAQLGATEAVFTLHRRPENNCSTDQAYERFVAGTRDFCRRAASAGVTLYLQSHPFRCGWNVKNTSSYAAAHQAFMAEVDVPNLRFALNTGHTAMVDESLADVLAVTGDNLGMILLSAPRRDLFGQIYDAHAPIYGSEIDVTLLDQYAALPWVLDADYPDQDAEYRDWRMVWGR